MSLLLAVTCVAAGNLAAVEPGFKELFNGKDLQGWDGNPQLWSVQDGAITGRTTKENPLKSNTFLIWTNGTAADFELRFSFKLTPNNTQNFANSGVQYRSKVLDAKTWRMGGYQADMEAGASYTGILYEEGMTRGIMAQRGEKVEWSADSKKTVTGTTTPVAEIEGSIKKTDWNDYVVIARGAHLQHFVNGKLAVDVMDNCESKRVMSGLIGLQVHAGEPMTTQFKNLRIKTLD
jgi:hypothetical protein